MENRSSRTNQDACSTLSHLALVPHHGTSMIEIRMVVTTGIGGDGLERRPMVRYLWESGDGWASGNCPSLRSIKVPILIQALLRTKHPIQSMPNSRKTINNWQICCLSSTLH